MKLANDIGTASAVLVYALHKNEYIPNKTDPFLLECMGFIYAHLHRYKLIDSNLIPEIIRTLHLPSSYEEHISSSAEFYSLINYRIFKAKDSTFYYAGIILNNLSCPKTWDEEILPRIEHLDFFKITGFWLSINELLVNLTAEHLAPTIKELNSLRKD